MITSFSGEYKFLSNFYHSPITVLGLTGDTVEHLYQAWKAESEEDLRWVLASPTPGEAKKRGRKVRMTPKWESMKKTVMFDLVMMKFSTHGLLLEKLLDTENELLVEGNSWGDDYWGSTDVWEEGLDYSGHNYLGKILMMVRDLKRVD